MLAYQAESVCRIAAEGLLGVTGMSFTYCKLFKCDFCIVVQAAAFKHCR